MTRLIILASRSLQDWMVSPIRCTWECRTCLCRFWRTCSTIVLPREPSFDISLWVRSHWRRKVVGAYGHNRRLIDTKMWQGLNQTLMTKRLHFSVWKGVILQLGHFHWNDGSIHIFGPYFGPKLQLVGSAGKGRSVGEYLTPKAVVFGGKSWRYTFI